MGGADGDIDLERRRDVCRGDGTRRDLDLERLRVRLRDRESERDRELLRDEELLVDVDECRR